MKKFFLFIIVAGAGFVLCALQGIINVPGLTPATAPSAEKGEAPKEQAPEKKNDMPAPTTPRKDAVAPAPEAKKNEAPQAPEKKFLYPAIQPADVERAHALYAKADFPGVARALEGCERPEIEDGPSTLEARSLVRKARLLDAITQGITRNPLADPKKKVEQITLSAGGTPLGIVTDLGGGKIRILMMGNVTTEVNTVDVESRTPVDRAVLVEKLRDRLAAKVNSVKADDAFGNMRLGHYYWQYGMDVDAVPYLDKAVTGDDFPVLARVFGGKSADKLVDAWYVFSGKSRPGPADRPGPRKLEPVSHPQLDDPPTPPPPPSSGGSGNLTLARQKYDAGVEKYKESFGDSDKARASLKAAHELFKQARDSLGDGEDAATDDLRMQISRLIYDCSKRSAIN
jgi:hypothetical protein